MHANTTREPCIRCGVSILLDHGVSLKTVMQLSKLAPSDYAKEIVVLEGIPLEVAQEFVDHKMGHRCAKVDPPCPTCGAALKTWHATGCWTCGWRRESGKPLTECYPRGA